MKLYFSDQPLPQSITKTIFLGGPPPRSKDVQDWRHEAVSYLRDIQFSGEVLIPIPESTFNGGNENPHWSYLNQIDWECKARALADKIVFWIPRDIKGGLPVFTTNFEFGEDFYSGKIIYGRPQDAEKCRYIDARYKELNLPLFNELIPLLHYTKECLGDGSLRIAGESHLYKIKLEPDEFQFLLKRQAEKTNNGEKNDGELTYVIIANEAELHNYPIDYANLGMIYQSLHQNNK